MAGWIVEPGLNRHLRRSIRCDGGQDVNRIQRHSGKIDQVYMPVEAPIEAKVAEFGRNPFMIWSVVAADRDRHAIFCLCWRKSLDRFGDVESKLVITANVRCDKRRADPQRGRLPRALKVQYRPSIGKGIRQEQPRAVPPLAAEVGLGRIALVERVKTVRQLHRLPWATLRGTPNSLGADGAAMKLPTCVQPARVENRPVQWRDRFHGDGAKRSREQAPCG